MGWMEKLCQAYDSCIGTDMSGEEQQLIPVGFTQKNIKYLVTINADSEFENAKELSKEESPCIIPTTPQAESRTGDNGPPFPLAEQLKYLVCDESGNPRFDRYMEQLSAWCEEPTAPKELRVLRDYLSKKTLYSDDENDELWTRRDVIESWSAHISTASGGDGELCYITGKHLLSIKSHPKVQGNAKLISSDDGGYPFRYKGRFTSDSDAASVSYNASVCAHNALKWLVARRECGGTE